LISDATVVFPNNVVNLVATRMALLDSDLLVVKRPLRPTDTIQAIGIFAAQWSPDENSYEMDSSPVGRSEPTISRYNVSIQALIKDADEERGLATHSVLSKMVRSVLYRDEPLRVGLTLLSATLNSSTERTKRWGIATQRYYSNEISGSWLYLSTLDFWLETETS